MATLLRWFSAIGPVALQGVLVIFAAFSLGLGVALLTIDDRSPPTTASTFAIAPPPSTALVVNADLIRATATPALSAQQSPAPSSQATATPIAGNFVSYTVLPGDTLSGIAGRLDTTVEAIQQANNIATPSLISPGQILRVPGAAR